jgi:hypothetical protein
MRGVGRFQLDGHGKIVRAATGRGRSDQRLDGGVVRGHRTTVQSTERRSEFGVGVGGRVGARGQFLPYRTYTTHKQHMKTKKNISSYDKLQQSYVRTTSSVLISAGSFSLRYSFAARNTYCPQCFSI